MMEIAPVAGIAIVLYVLSEILKRTVFKNNTDMTALIPYICAILGAVGAVIIYVVDPTMIDVGNALDAVVAGAASGLIATGANQIYKQFYNLLAIAQSTKTEVDTAVANMSTEEKKEFIANQVSDVLESVLDKVQETADSNKTEDSTTANDSTDKPEANN